METTRRFFAAVADAARRKARVTPERDEEDRTCHGPAPADVSPRVHLETFAHRNSVLRACSSIQRGPQVYRWSRSD